MRWAALFRDLEAEFTALEAADLDSEVRDRSRAEMARVPLGDRLRAAVEHPLTVRVAGAHTVQGRLLDLGADWLLLADSAGSETVVPLQAVQSVTGLGLATAAPGSAGPVAARLTLAYALRGLARGRAPVLLVTRDGDAVHGTIDRVGADFVELAEHPPGEPRRAAEVRGVQTVPLAAVALVRSA